jgi:hypothetical protein
MTPTLTTTVNRIREDDLAAHIEDTRLFHLFRNGRAMKLTWNELTAKEKEQQREAAARAAYVQAFDIY